MFLELLGVSQRLYSIVHGGHLARVDTIFFYHRPPRQVRYAHDMVSLLHTAFLDSEHRRVHISARAVEVGCMHVYHERLARNLLSKHTCWVGQPVVRVDDIEVQRVCQHGCHGLVVANLLNQVVGIASREAHTTEVVGADAAVVVANTIAQVEILLGRHLAFHALLHIVVVVLFPYNRHAVRTNNLQERLIFIAPRLRDNEGDVHVGLLCHAARQTVTGSTQTAQDMRGKLPSEH